MTVDCILRTVERETIRTFSMLDGWFDEDHAVLDFRPEEKAWTAREILEHVMLTSSYLMILIDKGSAKALKQPFVKEDFDWEQYTLFTKELLDIGDHKSFVWDRPDHMEPKGDVAIDCIRENMRAQLMKCLDHLDALQNGEGVLYRTTMTVNSIGKLDVYQYIYFLALHGRRHLDQLNYNKKEYLQINT
ncbi:DinB family protein [Chryseolinea lacunae]|uniref:DinB family protein n=1 Tax=Chryseolinea lacunae TaxID=2801331 RepID=A0ABS1KRH2_9BACT|nr:DinB family protein [Chryseolinea lacunae]MBL0742044.1 DinB family protein [Chryseolinea lacunae]